MPRPGTRRERDPQYAFGPGLVGAALNRLVPMGFDMPIPTATIIPEIPRMAFPPLSAKEIAYLRGLDA